mmetsp:Transcript_11209/g.23606  ORF Transcript_11209/g.23606 Transcript_11209/m.23606 type:complete len:362 (+) Transcript_11209:165-1250(+)
MTTSARRSLSILVVVSSVIGIQVANAFTSPYARRTPAGVASNNLFRSSSALRVIPIDGDGEKNNYEGNGLNQRNTPTLSPMRVSRLEREEAIRSRFATGDELRNLHDDMKALKQVLKWCRVSGDVHRVGELRETIKLLEGKDPEVVYTRAISAMNKAEKIEDLDKRKFVIDQHRSEANLARSCIPRFNLEGLWVGNYGNGAELVNITYSDAHTLVATKVTGDAYIPRGERSFSANLAPSDEADPIELSESAASKWGNKKLQRFKGKGSVALEGYKDEKNVEGQLVMFDDYFSFTWVPMKYTVFFSRPSAKLTIDLLRDVVSKEDEVDNMREHISRCFSKDAVIDRDVITGRFRSDSVNNGD